MHILNLNYIYPMNPTNSNTSPVAPSFLVQLKNLASGSSLEVIPVILFALYIIGFLCLNTHLARFPIVETNLLSFNYIKASLVFIAFSSLIMSITKKVAYDFGIESESEKRKDKLLSNIALFSFLTNSYSYVFYIYDSVTINHYKNFTDDELRYKTILLAFYGMLIFLIILSHKSKRRNQIYTFVVLNTINIVLFCLDSAISTTILYYMLSSSAIYFIIFFQIYNNWQLVSNHISISITISTFLLVVSIICFGAYVYDKIPQVLGGGKAYKAELFLTKNEMEALHDCHILDAGRLIEKESKVVYFSDKGFYINNDSKIIIIPAESVKGIKADDWLFRHFF